MEITREIPANELELEKQTSSMTLQQIKDLAFAAAQADAAAEAEPVVYRRTVRLPDGSDKVFEADSMESLMDQVIADREARVVPPPPPAPAAMTDDERFVLAQELASQPDVAFEKLLLMKTGLTPAQFREQVKTTAEEKSNAAAATFVENNPEYLAIPRNGQVLQDHLKKLGFGPDKPMTVASIQKAYEECRDAGLLQERVRPEDLTNEQLKALANNQPIVVDEAGSQWDF